MVSTAVIVSPSWAGTSTWGDEGVAAGVRKSDAALVAVDTPGAGSFSGNRKAGAGLAV